MFSKDRNVRENRSGGRSTGNSFFSAIPVQAKLKINEPNDKYEQEADRVADEVVRTPESQIGNIVPSRIQRKCEACEDEELDRKENLEETPTLSPDLEAHIGSLTGEGRPMSGSEKSFFEPRFNRDFSSVRIHENDPSAEKINARAYTTGNHIVLNPSESPNNKRLMAHELTHVVQQGESAIGLNRKTTPGIQRQDGTDDQHRLTPEDRSFLYDRITFRMGIAYDKFVDACNTHQRNIRETAAQNAAFAGLVLDLVLAFATRGISRVITAGISGAVRREASEAVYRVALGALDRVDAITAAATTIGKEVAKRGFESIFSRSEDEQFVEDLKQVMSVFLDGLHGNMQRLTDEELSILYFNYDPSLVTIAYYERILAQLISDFRSQISPIGKRTDERYGVNRLRWIEGRSRRALALTGEGRYFMANGRPRFLAWITPFFREEALSRSRPQTLSTFPVVHYGSLEGGSAPVNIGSILDSPYPVSGEYVFAAAIGQTPVAPSPCPSCHGETGDRSSGFPNGDFDFPQFEQRQTNDLLLQWLRQDESQ